MKYIKLICLSGLLVVANFIVAQNVLDSIKHELVKSNNTKDDISLLISLGNEYISVNIDSARHYLNKAEIALTNSTNIQNLAEYYKIKGSFLTKEFKNEEAISTLKTSLVYYADIDSIYKMSIVYNLIGNCFNNLRTFDSSLYYYKLSHQNLDSTKNLSLMAANLNNIAIVYEEQGDMKKALNNYLKALLLFKKLDQKEHIAITTNNVGLINLSLKNYNKAIVYFEEAAALNQEQENYIELCSNYNSLGITYRKLEMYDTAIVYINKAILIADKSSFQFIQAQSNHNLGAIYIKKKNYSKAINHLNISLAICDELGITSGKIFNIISLGEIYTKQKKFELSEEYLLLGLELCKDAKLISNYENIYEALMINYKEWGKYREAYNYYNQYTQIKDSLFNIQRLNELNEIQTKYESEQKELENQRLKDENNLQESIIFRQRIIVIATILIAIFAILLLAMVIVIRKGRKERIAILQAKNKLINEKSEQLEESNETKNKLFSIIAHDLRSPFTSLLGFSSMLMEEAKEGNFKNTLYLSKNLSLAISNTFELLDNLLNWSRSQQNSIISSSKQLNLLTVIHEIIQPFMVKADEKQIEIDLQISNSIDVHSDKNVLMVILRNLLSNAIKFTYKGGKIIVGCEELPDNFIVTIKDDGKGIDSSIVNKILSDKLGYTTIGTENEKGSGLGLMLVKDFVTRIGGTIWVESIPEKGSTFSFTIPKV